MKPASARSEAHPAAESPSPDPSSSRREDAVTLADVAEATPKGRRPPRGTLQARASGRSLAFRPLGGGEDLLTVRSPGGDVEIEVRLTREGPLIRASGAALHLDAASTVRVDCDTFHVRARERIVEESGGDLSQEAAGDASLKAGGHLDTEARSTTIRSRRGDTRVEANDDVKLKGERVRLNC